MRKIICIAFLIISASIAAYSQTAKIRVRNIGMGKIAVTQLSKRATIDLGSEVAGCSYVPPGPVKRNLDKKGCTAGAAEFKLIDTQSSGSKTYLLLQSEAAGNCNVCGQCGADSSYALIWVRLNANLRLESKKSAWVDYCRIGVNMVNPETTDEGEPIFKFKGDKLTVEYEERTYNPDETITYKLSHLEYNRRQPARGLVIKTEKRDKSVRDN